MILHDLLDFVLPRTCAVCGRRLATAERVLCVGCLRGLPRVDYAGNGQHGTIERLFWGQLPIERAASMFYYSSQDVREMVHNMKYHDQPQIGTYLGEVFADEMSETDFFDGIDVVMPLPLHWWRQAARGYNQSEMIARGLARATHLPVVKGVVRRVVNNGSQTHLNSAERRKNVEHVFRLVHPERVAGCHVLLVDDVLTTGSTLISCGRELAQAPGVRISVFTLAWAHDFDMPAPELT